MNTPEWDQDHMTCRQFYDKEAGRYVCAGYHCSECGEATGMYGHYLGGNVNRVVCNKEERVRLLREQL